MLKLSKIIIKNVQLIIIKKYYENFIENSRFFKRCSMS